MATAPGTLRFGELAVSPGTPPPDYAYIYLKTDNVLYIKDSSGTEVALGSSSSITELTGDVTAVGPGVVAATVVFVGGKTAAEVATSVNDTQAATSSNTPSTIVKRDGSGNFSAGTITANLTGNVTGNVNGVDPALHGSRHAPAGADPIPTAAAVTQIPDQANAEGTANSIARSDHIHNIPSGVPVQIGTSNSQGAAASFALSDHIHSHGNQTSGTLHAVATTSVNGFLSAADKVKIDNSVPATLGTANQVVGVNNAGTAAENKSLLGTANQVIVTHGVGTVTFSTPQDIATSSTPTFTGENLTDRLQLSEQSAPTTPAANNIRVFAEDSNGFTRLRAIDDTGYTSTILRDTILIAKNTSGSTISKGKAVYISSADSTNGVVIVSLAKADSSSTVPSVGLAAEDITNGSFGRILRLGNLNNLDTSAFSDGQQLYLSATTAGNLTSTKPTSPNIWQRIAVVIKAHATTGILLVTPFATHGEESGTNTALTLNQVILTDAATITVNAALGNTFSVTLGGNRTLAAPTNPTDGQKIVFRFRQDGTGNRTITFDAIYRFGLDIVSFVCSTGANKLDYVGFMYNAADSRWDCLAVSKGFN